MWVASASEDASLSAPNCTSGPSPRWRKHGSCHGTELSGSGNRSLAGTELEPLSGAPCTKVLLGQPASGALVNVYQPALGEWGEENAYVSIHT